MAITSHRTGISLRRCISGESDSIPTAPEWSILTLHFLSDGDYGEWSRVPKIMQVQPEGGYLDIDESPVHYPNRLSTITEHTERTEAQSMYTKGNSTMDRSMGKQDLLR